MYRNRSIKRSRTIKIKHLIIHINGDMSKLFIHVTGDESFLSFKTLKEKDLRHSSIAGRTTENFIREKITSKYTAKTAEIKICISQYSDTFRPYEDSLIRAAVSTLRHAEINVTGIHDESRYIPHYFIEAMRVRENDYQDQLLKTKLILTIDALKKTVKLPNDIVLHLLSWIYPKIPTKTYAPCPDKMMAEIIPQVNIHRKMKQELLCMFNRVDEKKDCMLSPAVLREQDLSLITKNNIAKHI